MVFHTETKHVAKYINNVILLACHAAWKEEGRPAYEQSLLPGET